MTRPRMLTWLDAPVVTRLIQIIAIASLLLAIGVGVKQYSLADCLADYNDAYSKVQGARLDAAEQDRRAQDRMFEAVANDPRNAIPAIRSYTTSRAAADEQRKRNPLPQPPKVSCR